MRLDCFHILARFGFLEKEEAFKENMDGIRPFIPRASDAPNQPTALSASFSSHPHTLLTSPLVWGKYPIPVWLLGP